jgi:hypothetical protein
VADQTDAACVAASGTWNGVGSVCDPDPCAAVPTGACCTPSGCQPDMTAAICEAESGTWQGDGTTCDPDPCVAVGSCCVSGQCNGDMAEQECMDATGTWNGANTTCDSHPCTSGAGGACCSDGTCYPVSSVTECEVDYWGDFQGDGSDCATTICM